MADGSPSATVGSGATTTSVPASSAAPAGDGDAHAASLPSAPPEAGAALPAVSRVGRSTGCEFAAGVESVAFCDTFDQPTVNPLGSRSGDLDTTVWGVSRTNTVDSSTNLWLPVPESECGPAPQTTSPADVRICNGKVYETVDDGTGQSTLALYPKQPFDIADGRPGTIVFDVSADSEGPHAAWPEFWWTDQPLPAPHGHMASQAPYARNSFGFEIDAQCPDASPYTSGRSEPYIGIGNMHLTVDSKAEEMDWTRTSCVLKGDADRLNHFEVRFNVNGHSVEVWGSDPGGAKLRMMAHSTTPMPLDRGVIWVEDVHYNANKFDTQRVHTFVWDNVGFDGPTPYRDLTFDVADNATPADGGVGLGYRVTVDPVEVTAPGVYWLQQPTKAYVMFNFMPYESVVPVISLNGGPWHETEWPFDPETYAWRTIAIDVPLDEVLPGDNTISFRDAGTMGTTVANINLALIAASPVPPE